MQVQTTRFGTLAADESKIIHFPRGIPGFDATRRFIILPVEENDNSIHWLQSLDEPSLALLVIDPFTFFPGYSFKIPEQDIKQLEIRDRSEVLVMAVTTVPRDKPGESTANLAAPIIVNSRLNKGKQIILDQSPYSIKHKLFPPGKKDGQKDRGRRGEGE